MLVHQSNTQYFTLATHIKRVKVMQICLTRDPGLCSVQQDRKDRHLEKFDLTVLAKSLLTALKDRSSIIDAGNNSMLVTKSDWSTLVGTLC